jgi:hypothetical protein
MLGEHRERGWGNGAMLVVVPTLTTRLTDADVTAFWSRCPTGGVARNGQACER